MKIYEARIVTSYVYNPTSGHRDGEQHKATQTTTTESTGVFFTSDQGNLTTTSELGGSQ